MSNIEVSAGSGNPIERQLIELIEIIEGRVPANTEVAAHLLCGVFANGCVEYKWKGNTILVIRPIEWRHYEGK